MTRARRGIPVRSARSSPMSWRPRCGAANPSRRQFKRGERAMFRRRFLIAALTLAGTAGLWAKAANAEDKVLRIGYQKYGTLVLLKEKGTLEPELRKLGYSVTWSEFPGGPQLL